MGSSTVLAATAICLAPGSGAATTTAPGGHLGVSEVRVSFGLPHGLVILRANFGAPLTVFVPELGLAP